MSDPSSRAPHIWPLGTLPGLGDPLPDRMNALVIRRDAYGPPGKAIRLETVPAPRLLPPDARRVLVAVLATGPNFNTNFAALGLPVPVFGRGDASALHIPGSDAVGIVVDAGPAVARVKVGQAVILDSWTGRNIRGYETHDGFNAQIVAVDEDRAWPVPPALSGHAPERLAPLLLTYGTAYRAVVERLAVRPGDAVLVLGGGKGTSFPGAQIATALGARVILVGSNPDLAASLIRRGFARAFIDRRTIPREAFGPIGPGEDPKGWEERTEPFRAAVRAANGGRLVDKVFEHTGGDNFPLLVSAVAPNGTLAFFGATGKGVKGEYRETFFCDGRRFVFDARWVWMRQKQILFRKDPPERVFREIGLLPGRRALIWGADAPSRRYAKAALARSADVAVIASFSREAEGIRSMKRLGVPPSNVIDRDAFDLPEDMPDPLTDGGGLDPAYAAGFMKPAQALGRAIWGVFGPRTSPDVIVERTDRSTLHFSAFLLRDFDETDAMPCGTIVFRSRRNLSIRGSHMYHASQAGEVLRLLASGSLVLEPGDIDIVPIEGLPAIQQKMLDGRMEKPKGVALVQAGAAGRPIADFVGRFAGTLLRAAAPSEKRYLEIRALDGVIVLAVTRPDALNALNEELLAQIDSVVQEIRTLGTVEGTAARALILTGSGRAFVAGADVKEFLGRRAEDIARLAARNIGVFGALENLSVPVIAVVDGFALGGGNELAMSAHYRIVTENASLGQPEVKLGIIPGYGGMQRLPRLVGPRKAAAMCANGEPVDGREAVAIGLADEIRSSSTALLAAVRLAREAVAGGRKIPRKDWDALGGRQRGELDALFADPEAARLLDAPRPGEAQAQDLESARRAAAGEALRALRHGYGRGFSAGLENDARAFGRVTASPGGQTWVERFVAKDPRQSSFLTLLPDPPAPKDDPPREPITKKAPGDRPLSGDEIRSLAALIVAKEADGKVRDIPDAVLKELSRRIRKGGVPPFLSDALPPAARGFGARIAGMLRKKAVLVRSVDLGDATGFPRENARPTCEVLLVQGEDGLRDVGKRRLVPAKGETPVIFVAEGLLRGFRVSPSVLVQAVVHPLLEWLFGLPHMAAVLCESSYNDAETAGDPVSDLNRFIAVEAGRERDFAYFDRILSTPYEPDELRLEELRSLFPSDEAKIREVVALAKGMGESYRALLQRILLDVRGEMARDRIREARRALDEGDADRALQALRKIRFPSRDGDPLPGEAAALVALSIGALAHDADPAYEGIRMERGKLAVEPGGTGKARALAALLRSAVETVRARREKDSGGGKGGSDPLGESGAPREVHVIHDLERPSAKFIDGHDAVHWVFEKSFVETLLRAFEGTDADVASAFLACRFVRDGVFPDEKLKVDRQYAAAVRGAVEGYRFFQGLPGDLRGRMEAFHEESGLSDGLFRLFRRLGGETNFARAGHVIRAEVARTHSYNQVRYPDTPLAGQVVVITGGGTGMGRAIALEAAKGGANVVILGRRPDPLEETRADILDLIRHLGLTNQALSVQGDVGDSKYVGEMFERIEKAFGRIDILFNNAGVSGPVEFGSVYSDDLFEAYRETMRIHLTGSWLASLEASRVMERQPSGGVIVMVGTFYAESIHRHVLHAYPGRLPYTSAQSAKLALGDYLAWALAGKNVTVLSLNPSAVSTDRIRKGSGVFDKGARARARIGRSVTPEALERDTLGRTVSREFVHPRDFARFALETHRLAFRRTVGGQRIPMGGVTYEQPPAVTPSPARLHGYPDLVGKVAVAFLHKPMGNDLLLYEATARALARSGANVVLATGETREVERIAAGINAAGGEGMATVAPVRPTDAAEAQELFSSLPRIDLLVHFTGSVDWKRPLQSLPCEEWESLVDRFGAIPRLFCWHAERRMDRDGADGTIVVVGADLSGVPSIRERHQVQVFQSMLRPAVATESMERAMMRKAQADGTSPARVGDVNVALVLPGRTDGRNRQPDPGATAATVLWLAGEGKNVSGAVLLPDEQNATARLPDDPPEAPGTMGGKVTVVTGGIRNLGREISLRCAREGGIVFAASRRPKPEDAAPDAREGARKELAAADETLARMRRAGGRAVWIDADVSRPAKVRGLIDEAVNRFGRVDAFVNNAGAGGAFSLFEDVLRDHRASWEEVLRANFLGPLAAVAHLRRILRRQDGGGVIVNVSTHYADHPYLFRTIYTTSKIMLKALTQALAAPLAADGIRIADVAPTLIAGPRMDWVMARFAGNFAGQFDAIGELRPAERDALRHRFLRSFDRAVPKEERDKARRAFVETLRDSALPRRRRSELEGWYERIRDWFCATVPDAPPSNAQVAEAVLFAAKTALYLENRFLPLTTLPPFRTFPPVPETSGGDLRGAGLLLLSAGGFGGRSSPAAALAPALSRAGARITALVERPEGRGEVGIERPSGGETKGSPHRPAERIVRTLDLSDPRIVEPWLDRALLGAPAAAGAVVCVGCPGGGDSLLDASDERMEGLLAHVTKALNLVAESARGVRAGAPVAVVAPAGGGEAGAIVRAALRQMVRTRLAEQHFLPSVKKAGLSLLLYDEREEGAAFADRVSGILSGARPAEIAPVSVGPPRP